MLVASRASGEALGDDAFGFEPIVELATGRETAALGEQIGLELYELVTCGNFDDYIGGRLRRAARARATPRFR